jgi:type IV pilus assembly protein PilX
MKALSSLRRARHTQRGVVLIMALIMLVVVSMLATMSIRNATSSESVSGNVRTTQLATQVAEIALRYCEDTLAARHQPAPPAAPAGWSELAYSGASAKANNPVNWDKVTTDVFVVPTTSINSGSITFKRAPECMVENIRVVSGTPAMPNTTSTFIVTARGFGPEVAPADGTRTRPVGSEVWLQSTVELN